MEAANTGLEGRFPPTAVWKKVLLGAFFMAAVIGFAGNQWGHAWYERLIFFGSLPWFLGLMDYIYTLGARRAYSAAIDDSIESIIPIARQLYLAGTIKASEFNNLCEDTFLRLRPKNTEIS